LSSKGARLMSDGPAVRAEELVTRAMRYVTWSGYFALFALATLIFGLIAACFVPTDWVVTRKDYVYLQMHHAASSIWLKTMSNSSPPARRIRFRTSSGVSGGSTCG